MRCAVWANQDADEAVKRSCKDRRDIDPASQATGRSAAALPENSFHGQRLGLGSTAFRERLTCAVHAEMPKSTPMSAANHGLVVVSIDAEHRHTLVNTRVDEARRYRV